MIDDLFKENTAKSDGGIILEIMNFRYFNNLFMVVNCEKDAKKLLDIGEPIGIRVIEINKYYLVEIKGRRFNFRA
ncbi:hypothetical protein WS9_005705 [Paraclostridium sordellii 8483]|uniref:hypothetical protein n=1 Tax=Paraclostridium sordellii TaxID=1505 RepID=UPI00065998A4|nr:hypothetical protein [Paeniclostridium sordellii]TAN68442.1 hypothetical protein WS9_005705 [Paeniclostridium sordellii 8483]